jgi:DNA (cytosine-5)-methyltransferase 1
VAGSVSRVDNLVVSQSAAPKDAGTPTFVDVFAGCGGLSLGMLQAGLQGRFAVEQDAFAFATLRTNLLDGTGKYRFAWPEWLPKEPVSIEVLLAKHLSRLRAMAGTIDVLVGGPPCQGFSSAGKRRLRDPRNQLFDSYMDLVDILQPRAVVVENVRGFAAPFGRGRQAQNFADKLRERLSTAYQVHARVLKLSTLGLPQERSRFFALALRAGITSQDPFELLEQKTPTYLRRLGLQAPVSSWSAISDLELSRGGSRASVESPGFQEICASRPFTRYQKLLSDGEMASADLRLARHSAVVARRFAEIIDDSHSEGRLNTSISAAVRERYGLSKQALRVLDPDRPSPTVTSMPDDLLHYKEPRTLTVRENARLQGFPDWFTFKGKYTTGGALRRREVPRYTQVANAVPPLVARAIGEMLLDLLGEDDRTRASEGLAGPKRHQKASKRIA